MTYTVLARKYRPQTFDDLVGQEHVTRTLGNAITSNRVAHAFLFTGVRGVGKTTTARLLAKALCCEKGPTPSPCNQCAQCIDITAGVDMDVLEIDGASHNSVEDVRRLQETIPFQPTRNRFRIVIVDEVHMLSAGAFNAFLKTLEEPPAHVKFIFATTESHKVPITIRSRCQRYDFRLIPQATVTARVRQILDLEHIGADDAAVQLVAREAAGSLRDALTLLDQVVALSGDTLEGAELARVLGIADRQSVQAVAQALLEGDPRRTLELLTSAANQGADILHFAKQLLGHMRDLVVLAVTAGEPGDLLDLVDEELAAATDLAKSVDVQELQRTFAGLSALVDEIARASVPRAVLEMGLVRLASRPRLESIATLMARVEDLARRAGGGPAPTGGGRPGGSASGPASAPPSRPTGSRGATASGPIAPQTAASPKPSPTNSAPSPRPASPKVAPEPPSTSVAAPATAPADPPTMDATEAWAKVVADVRDRKPAFGAVLEHALPVEVGPARVVLSFAEGAFYGRQAATPEGQGIISEGVGRAIGGSPKVEIRYHKDAPVAGKTVAQMEQTRRDEAREETRKRALNHPRVIEALQVFPEAAGNVKVQYENE